jgi:hypothetical protein
MIRPNDYCSVAGISIGAFMKRLALILAMLFIPALSRADGPNELFTYQNGVFTFLGVPDQGLPLLPLGFDTLIHPNSFGQVTTWDNNGSYIVSSTGMLTSIALPTGCIAFGGINDSGQVAGVCLEAATTPNGTPFYSGFIDTGGHIEFVNYKVPNDGSTYDTFFEGINNSGVVIGSFEHVPESSTIVLLITGLVALAILVVRQSLIV